VRRLCFTIVLMSQALMLAQESQLGADLRGEGERFDKSCAEGFSLANAAACAELLFTDHPLHIAVGSLAPGNGFAAGAAFVAHWTPNETWRLSWDTDAVASENGSWRAGAYMTAVLSRRRKIVVGTGGSGATPKSNLTVQEYPVFHAYVQDISLNSIGFYGIGPNTGKSGQSLFGMNEAIAGVNAVWPLVSGLNLSLYGEANGRFVSLRGDHGQSSPSIEQIYTESSAPGLASQPAFAQFGEGVRIGPELASGHVQLNYSATLDQFAAANSAYSFQRFIADLDNEFPIYRKTAHAGQAKTFNGPDDCSADVAVKQCPAITRDREGSFGVRLYLSESMIPSSHTEPFYFQPTLGGSDIDGNMWLASYADYRFRAPNLLVLRGSFEHSIYGPLGAALMVDEGKVGLRPGDLDFTHLAHSYAAGVTLRAGGLPMLSLMFAWGGDTTHVIANVNTSLLGGSARPSLF